MEAIRLEINPRRILLLYLKRFRNWDKAILWPIALVVVFVHSVIVIIRSVQVTEHMPYCLGVIIDELYLPLLSLLGRC